MYSAVKTNQNTEPQFPIPLPWLAVLVAASVSLTSFIYVTFETKAESSDAKRDIEKRLDRIEDKLDRILTVNKSK